MPYLLMAAVSCPRRRGRPPTAPNMYWNVAGAPVTLLFMMRTLLGATSGTQTSWSVMIFCASMTSWARLVASGSLRAASRAASYVGVLPVAEVLRPTLGSAIVLYRPAGSA